MTVSRSLWAAACVCLASGCSPTPPPPAPVFAGPPGVLGLTLIGAGSTAPPSLDAARTALGQHLPGMSLVSAVPKALTGPVVLMESLDRQGFQPPAPATLRRQGRGLSEADIVHITNTDHALAMVFVTPSPDQLQTVTQASALAVELALQTGAYIQDDDTLEVFSVDAWQATRRDGWVPTRPDAAVQLALLATADGDALRAGSRGMARFGRPDVVVEGFAPPHFDGVDGLIQLTAQHLMESPTLPTEPTLTLDIRALQSAAVQQRLAALMVPGAQGQATVRLSWPPRLETDPENALMGVHPPEGQDWDAVLTAVFGTPHPGGDPVQQAHEAAVEQLLGPEKALFMAGLPDGESLMVKGPFDAPDGSIEWMWVVVQSWDNGVMSGMLDNAPANIPTLKAGDPVTVTEADAFDFLHVFPDGRTVGNTTGAVLIGG